MKGSKKNQNDILWSVVSFILTKGSLTLIILSSGFLVSAQQCTQCNESLRKDIFKYSTSSFTYASYMEEITEHEYEELKKNISSSASIPIPEVGAIVDASISYDDFKKRIHDYTLKIKSTQFGSQIVNYEIYRTQPIAYDAWTKCMLACTDKSGVYLIKSNDTEANCIYKLTYRGGPNEPDVYYCKIDIVSEGKKNTQNIALKKGGVATFAVERVFVQNKSESIVTVNARKGRFSSKIAFSDDSKSIYVKPSGITVLSLDYVYWVKEYKTETGPTVQNCMLPPPRENPRQDRSRNFTSLTPEKVNSKLTEISNDATKINLALVTKYNTALKKEGLLDYTLAGCGRPMGISCDKKWPGYFSEIEIYPSSGYTFDIGVRYQDMLKFEGPMAAWNYGQRCPENDKLIIDNPDYKRLRLWMHQDVSAHLSLTSSRQLAKKETAYPNVDINGIVSFSIATSKLTKYSVEIRLSDGNIINVNESNVNEKAYLNIDGENTIFTLKK